MPEHTTGYVIVLRRSHGDRNWVAVDLRKQFWSVGTGTRSRAVATAGFYAQGMSERDIVESALRELLRAYVDEIA